MSFLSHFDYTEFLYDDCFPVKVISRTELGSILLASHTTPHGKGGQGRRSLRPSEGLCIICAVQTWMQLLRRHDLAPRHARKRENGALQAHRVQCRHRGGSPSGIGQRASTAAAGGQPPAVLASTPRSVGNRVAAPRPHERQERGRAGERVSQYAHHSHTVIAWRRLRQEDGKHSRGASRRRSAAVPV